MRVIIDEDKGLLIKPPITGAALLLLNAMRPPLM